MRTAEELIAEAMEGVRVEVCKRCKGFCEVGLPSMSTPCPDCNGRGVTTTNELEVGHEADA